MKDIISFSEYSLNESFGKSYIEKGIKVIDKIKHLFKNVKLTDDEIKKIVKSDSIKETIMSMKDYYSQVKDIVNKNKKEVQLAYDSVFGIKEEFLCSLLLSIAIMLGFYWAQKRGYIDKLLGRIDPRTKGGSCCGGEDVSGDEWKKSVGKKDKDKPKLGPPPKKSRREELDGLLDKMTKKGLNPEEKKRLKE